MFISPRTVLVVTYTLHVIQGIHVMANLK